MTYLLIIITDGRDIHTSRTCHKMQYISTIGQEITLMLYQPHKKEIATVLQIVSCYTFNKPFSLLYLYMYLQLYVLFGHKKKNDHKYNNVK